VRWAELFVAVPGPSNLTYAEMAAHYGMAIIPARPRRPRDKPRSKLACNWYSA
jgi:hypothetical protein